ncbi:MAG: hypothetical protein CMH57_07250 [Myxococcales bacterium]|nr:hypothetical protein [Myxococcales bacterium]
MKSLIGLIAAALLMLSGVVAHASHYDLLDLERFTDAQVRLFESRGLKTTEDVLKAALTPKARRQLARGVKLPEADLLVFARECELLQIRGVGPKMASLLMSAGVTGVEDLGRRDPQILRQRLQVVNDAEKIMEGLPPEGLLYNWIQQARGVAYKVSFE